MPVFNELNLRLLVNKINSGRMKSIISFNTRCLDVSWQTVLLSVNCNVSKCTDYTKVHTMFSYLVGLFFEWFILAFSDSLILCLVSIISLIHPQ